MLLLDSCTLLWWLAGSEALPAAVREELADVSRPAYVSTVSLWEILVKHSRGKIRIDSGKASAFDFLSRAVAAAGFEAIALTPADVRHVTVLPFIHRDPFDRMLICQAIERGLTLVTPDPVVRRYPVKTFWG